MKNSISFLVVYRNDVGMRNRQVARLGGERKC
jgi:hypothetical protein